VIVYFTAFAELHANSRDIVKSQPAALRRPAFGLARYPTPPVDTASQKVLAAIKGQASSS
jgi:hypothetical protein